MARKSVLPRGQYKRPLLQLPGPHVTLQVNRIPFHFAITDARGRTLLESARPPGTRPHISPLGCQAVRRQRARTVTGMWYFFTGRPGPWSYPPLAVSVETGDDFIEVDLAGEPEAPAELRVRFELMGPRAVRCRCLALDRPEVNRLAFWFRAGPEDRFFGLGQQYNAADQRGRRVPIWTEERSMGLGDYLGKIVRESRFNPFPRGPNSTYFPVPFFLNPRGYGLLVDGSHRCEFDLACTRDDLFGFTYWDRAVEWIFFYGPEPLRVIEETTAHTGRATVPAAWAFAPWNDAVGGEDRVMEVAGTLRREKIPSSAIWTEDWQHGRSTPLGYFIFPVRFDGPDRTLYPEIESLAGDLHDRGFRFLAYFFPYIWKGSALYREGREKGHFITDRRGRPCGVRVLFDRYGQIDLTRPEAREWMKGIFRRILDLGFDGWMADFGEYTPPQARFGSGEDGWTLHNRFPLLWQRLNREFFDEVRPDGDYVFFVRSGTTGSQRYAPVMWAGDQLTSWDRTDGLGCVLPAALSAGISGMPIWACDIAGYKSHTCLPSTRELFFRWTQIGALSPVMRTHHGVLARRNWSFDRDAETLELFGRYARLHTALVPYLYGCAHEAVEHGWPVMRHLLLHFPDDPAAVDMDDQYMFGPDILVAPVLKKGDRHRNLYLPQGEWIDFWTGRPFTGPGRIKVEAPLDIIPMFVRSGTLLPTFDLPVDTLVDEQIDGLVTYRDAVGSIRLTLFGKGETKRTLWDGTRLSAKKTGTADRVQRAIRSGRISVTKGRPVRASTDALLPDTPWGGPDRAVSMDGGSVAFRILDTRGRPIASGAATGPTSRRYTFQFA